MRWPTVRSRTAVLDGEVVALDEHGVSNFQQLQNSLKRGDDESLVYYVFDVPYLEGYDLTEAPLIERKEALARVLLLGQPRQRRRRFATAITSIGQGDKRAPARLPQRRWKASSPSGPTAPTSSLARRTGSK